MVSLFVGLCVCVFIMFMSHAKTAEPIKVPFGCDSGRTKELCIIWGFRSQRE